MTDSATVDLGSAVQEALFTWLKAGVTLTPVYQHVPEKTPPPVTIIGEMPSTDAGGKSGDRLERFEVDVAAVVRGPGKKPLLAVMEQQRAALVGANNEGRQVTVAGAQVNCLRRLSASDRLLDDGNHYYGTSKFLVFAQPTG